MAQNFGLFEYTAPGQGVAGGVAVSNGSAAAFLKRELGFLVESTRNNKAVAILQAPETQVPAYNVALAALYDTAGAQFKVDYDKLIALGLPDEKSRKIATAKAARHLEDEKQILDFSWPLASDMNIMATAAAKAGTQININQGGAKLSSKGRKKRQ